MKPLVAGLLVCISAAALSGCYVNPGYSYVRQTSYQGDAYYGHGVRSYDDGYYARSAYPAYSYGPAFGYGGYGGYGYSPGVSIGISSTWYSAPRYRQDRRGYPGYRYQGQRGQDHRGSWRSDGQNQRGQRSNRPQRDDRNRRTDR